MELVESESDVKLVERFLTESMSKPPAAVGLRIKPETELAELFGLGRWQMRQCLQSLVQKRILVRHQGKGTFLNRLPHKTSSTVWSDRPFEKILPHMLFMEPLANGGHKPFLFSSDSKSEYRIGFCGDLNYTNTTNQLLLAGINDSLSRRGHNLILSSMTRVAEKPISVEELSKKIKANKCDGYIVDDFWADHFLQALGDVKVPMVFSWPSRKTITREPIVMLDCEEAASRAVHILAGEGFKKIGLIVLQEASHAVLPEQSGYEHGLLAADLNYKSVTVSTIAIEKVVKAVKGLLQQPEAPDALYIADDFIMVGVAAALNELGIKPGLDIGVIFQGNYGHPLIEGNDWSRLEFDPRMFGETLVENLVRTIDSGFPSARNLILCANWRPGVTHRKQKTD